MNRQHRHYIPNLLLAGAPKCGTTTLAAWLADHPQVCMSRPKEPNVLAWDDFEVNPYSLLDDYDSWLARDFEAETNAGFPTYRRAFEHHYQEPILGDATPGYLFSERAVARAAELMPNARIIFMLRHPTDRAYSEYWHSVRHRRSTSTFENHLKYERSGALTTGRYLAHLQRWFDRFAAKQICVLTTERMRRAPEETMQMVTEFLDLERIPPGSTSRNRARTPRSINGQLVLNQLLRMYSARHSFLESGGSAEGRRRAPIERAVSGAIRRVGSLNLRSEKYPDMSDDTRLRLDAYFTRENAGLADLTGVDFETEWSMDL